MKVFFSSIAALALMAVPAVSDETHNWSGLYLGAHAGYAWGNVDVRDTDGGVNPGPFDYTANGAFGGGTVGANWQIGPFVMGPEVDLGYMNLTGSSTIPSSDPNYHQNLTLDGGFYAVAGGRVGVAFGNALIYGKGGWAFYDGQAEQATTKTYYTPTGTDPFSGFAYGGGLEYALRGGWSVKAEFLHFNFGTQGGVQEKTSIPVLPEPDDGTLIGDKFHNTHDLSADTVKIGINYKFGGDELSPLK